jgi:putative oxidoreductase
MGVPAPQAAALFAAVLELGGGTLLLVGLLTPVAAALVVLDMMGAFWSPTEAPASSSPTAAGNWPR